MFGIKTLEEILLNAVRTWSRPVNRPISTALRNSRPRYEICHNLNSCFFPSRFHHTATWATKSQLLRAVPKVAGVTSRHYSSVQSNQQPEEPDTLYKWIELRCKGHDDAVLESYNSFVSQAAGELGITVESISKPKKKIQKLTLLKSRHIFKKHRVQYEMRTHFRVIMLKHLTGSTADVFLEYIERNLPEGVAMQVKKCHLEKLPELLTQPTDDAITNDTVFTTQEDLISATTDSSSPKDVSEDSTTSSASSSESSDSSDDERPNSS